MNNPIESARNQEAAEGVIERAGKVFPYRHTGHGRLPYLCKKACCLGKERFDKSQLLPCECHSLITLCTCPLRDKHCQRCRKTWITGDRPQVDKYVQWYEIDDPHVKLEDLIEERDSETCKRTDAPDRQQGEPFAQDIGEDTK